MEFDILILSIRYKYKCVLSIFIATELFRCVHFFENEQKPGMEAL